VEEELVIPIVAILMPLVLVPSVMVMKHRQRKREFEHRERMRSLELGVPLVQTQPWPAAAVAMALGLGAPASVFLFSWLAVVTARVDGEVFIGATFVALAGVLSGARLALRLIPAGTTLRPSEQPLHAASVNGKPTFDPDTFDVVGRRG
jgi:hypothetical protein